MKKLMMLCAAVLGIAVAHGATVDWSASNLTAAKTGEDINSYQVFLVLDKTSAEVVKALEDGEWSTLGATAGTIEETVNGRTGKKAYSVSGTATTSHTVDDGEFSGVFVMFNGAPDTATSYSIKGMTSNVSEATGKADFSFGSQGSATWATNPASGAPEPTSALLMLMGGAMLALRRKQK